jgi:hypothetical protein
VLKVFRFGVESTAVSKAIEACGWQGMLDQVESIKAADLILAAKCSSTGKHRNLAQVGRRDCWRNAHMCGHMLHWCVTVACLS